MKNYIFPLLLILLLCTCVRAQSSHDALSYVQGPTYKVINHPSGPKVFWDDEPISITQIKNLERGLIAITPPEATEARLLISIAPDNRLLKVVDLAYERDPRLPQSDKVASPITTEDLEVNFTNGLKFKFADGTASATFEGKSVTVTGSAGRYRMETESFEAGVAFGPQWEGKVYQYLTKK
ncbi:MAG: hypothetical protein AAF597_18485 [Bacteroidota bacterium]